MSNIRFYDLYERDYMKRMQFARDANCNVAMLTGNGEPLLNRDFLLFFRNCNRMLTSPFRQVELQTSGMLMDDEYLRFLRNSIDVSLVSLSLSSMFSEENELYNAPKSEKFKVNIDHLCSEIKRYDFSLRLSLNLTDFFNEMSVEEIFARAKALGADQVTFRQLYSSGLNTPQDLWIEEHACKEEKLKEIEAYVASKGTPLQVLPFGAVKYSVEDISVVIDTNCMDSQEVSEDLKYLVLRPDCKTYSHWDKRGSLVF